MTIFDFVLLFGSVVLGGGLGFYLKKSDGGWLQLILSFSGAYILGITFLHLIPETYETGNASTGMYILIGFFVQLLLEQLSKGVEHGHIHALHHAGAGFTLMVGLCLHAFLEGMPLSGYMHLHEFHAHASHTHSTNHLLYGIILHKIPAAFALVVLLLLSGFAVRRTVIYLLIFASMSPLGAAVSSLLEQQALLTPQGMTVLMSLVIGSFFHIATTILFETDPNHRIPRRKLVAIAFGVLISFLTMHSN